MAYRRLSTNLRCASCLCTPEHKINLRSALLMYCHKHIRHMYLSVWATGSSLNCQSRILYSVLSSLIGPSGFIARPIFQILFYTNSWPLMKFTTRLYYLLMKQTSENCTFACRHEKYELVRMAHISGDAVTLSQLHTLYTLGKPWNLFA
jgi:hypothetical protein